MLRTPALRVLDARDHAEVLALLARDPVANVFVAARVEAAAAQPWRLAGELWGHTTDGRIAAVCHSGANLVPAEADEVALAAFAERSRRQGRRCSSIVGPADQVARLWAWLEPEWGAAREVRPDQPLLVIDGPPRVAPDPRVRPVRPDEVDLLLPASIAMFTEEVGVSPTVHDGGALYRARVAELVQAGRAYAVIEDGEVLFKAEVGAVSAQACQVQGVWVTPRLRGTGLSVPGMAAVVELARRSAAPLVSLYVNAHNVAARRCYDRVGFTAAGSFMSVLF